MAQHKENFSANQNSWNNLLKNVLIIFHILHFMAQNVFSHRRAPLKM